MLLDTQVHVCYAGFVEELSEVTEREGAVIIAVGTSVNPLGQSTTSDLNTRNGGYIEARTGKGTVLATLARNTPTR